MDKIALAGNPNCGKTTLFNRLTGSRQHIGNWAGVTVERKEGTVRQGAGEALLVDLPGLYSMTAYTLEEQISRDYLLSGEAGLVLNIIDGTSIRRGLYLTMQLRELGVPLVCAVGLMDEVEANGGAVDCGRLSAALGVPVVPISARNGQNVDRLVSEMLAPRGAPGAFRYGPRLEQALAALAAVAPEISSRFQLLRLLESPPDCGAALTPEQLERAKRIQRAYELADGQGYDAEALVAMERYKIIDRLVDEAVKPIDRRSGLSEQIDRLVLNRWLAIPLFCAAMLGMLYLCFAGPGAAMKGWMEGFWAQTARSVSWLMECHNVSPPLMGLVRDGILGGLGSVFAFLPQICCVFLFLTLLEECGYLARAAFLMDLPLRKLGLTGKSVIPMLLGFGCTTPAVMAARTLENERDRRMTILLTPFLPCSARFPVYALLTGVFFPRRQWLAVAALYLLGVASMSLYGLLLSRGPFKGRRTPFLMEFPPYRLPSLRNLLRNTGERCWDFLCKAGTVLFLLSVSIWMLQHFDRTLHYTAAAQDSLFNWLGGWIAPVFRPLGFGSREAGVAVLAGLAAKEAIVAALGVACGAGGPEALQSALKELFTPLSAAAFLSFCALYAPCVSALSTMRRELRSTGAMLLAAAGQTLFAYGVGMAVYQFGTLFCNIFL